MKDSSAEGVHNWKVFGFVAVSVSSMGTVSPKNNARFGADKTSETVVVGCQASGNHPGHEHASEPQETLLHNSRCVNQLHRTLPKLASSKKAFTKISHLNFPYYQ